MDETLAMAAVPMPEAGETPPGEIMIMPVGQVVTGDNDSRPPWLNDKPDAVIEASMASGQDLAIDFDHALARGLPLAPAAGWIKRLFVRDGAIWGAVEWTAKGVAALRSREYRFLSPEFRHTVKDRRVLRIAGAALVNRPALAEARALAAAEGMQLDEMRGALEMSSNADAANVLNALRGLLNIALGLKEDLGWGSLIKRARMEQRAEAAALGLDEAATPAELAAARAAAERVTGEMGGGPVQQAIAAGKIAPAARAEAEALAARDPQAFRAFAAAMPALLPNGAIVTGNAPPMRDTVLTVDEKTVAAACGVTDEQFRDSRTALAKAEAEDENRRTFTRSAWA